MSLSLSSSNPNISQVWALCLSTKYLRVAMVALKTFTGDYGLEMTSLVQNLISARRSLARKS